MNAGIAGNRVLSDGAFQAGINALARFEHDVLAQPGVTHVVVHGRDQRHRRGAPESIPDGPGHHRGPQADHRSGARRGLKIYGGTLTPFYGAAYYSEVGEAKRSRSTSGFGPPGLRRASSISTR